MLKFIDHQINVYALLWWALQTLKKPVTDVESYPIYHRGISSSVATAEARIIPLKPDGIYIQTS